MRRALTIPTVLAVLVLVAGVTMTYSHARTAGTVAVASPAALRPAATFEATVYSGPDKGLSLTGILKVRVTKTGQLSGVLAPRTGSVVPLTGQLHGLAINLVFYLGHGRHIFGVGTFGLEPGAKQWFLGGPLVGPLAADAGSWAGATMYAGAVDSQGNPIKNANGDPVFGDGATVGE
jgi:hypothetical protein